MAVLDHAVALDAAAKSYSYLSFIIMRALHGIGYELECPS